MSKKITNNAGFNMNFIENVEVSYHIKKLVNNCCLRLREEIGNTTFIIKPSCLVYSIEKGGFMEKTETTLGHGIYKDIEKEILVTLERAELKGVPRIFIGGKYKAMTQLMAQAKYNYPDRLMILKSCGGLRTCLIMIYRGDLDQFMVIEPSEHPMSFNMILKGDLV